MYVSAQLVMSVCKLDLWSVIEAEVKYLTDLWQINIHPKILTSVVEVDVIYETEVKAKVRPGDDMSNIRLLT